MRRSSAYLLLLLTFIAFGTGFLGYVHELQHDREDAATALAAHAMGRPVNSHPEHDDNNCPTHAQLYMLLILTGWALLLVCIGRSPRPVTVLPVIVNSFRIFWRIACRGPPMLSA